MDDSYVHDRVLMAYALLTTALDAADASTLDAIAQNLRQADALGMHAPFADAIARYCLARKADFSNG